MVLHKYIHLSCLLVGLLAVIGCSEQANLDTGGSGGAEVMPTENLDAAIVDAEVDAFFEHQLVPSIKARVKFKGAKRFGTDLASALGLESDSLCNELGLYNCLEVHQIVLGGMEPYRLGIHKPLPKAGLTAPIAADRVALAACAERVRRDFLPEGTPIFFEGEVPGAQAPSPEWRLSVANQLYQRILRRQGTPEETGALVDFYTVVQTEHGGASVEATRDWLSLSCFSVATMLEALFY